MSANAAAGHRVAAGPGWSLGGLTGRAALRAVLFLGCLAALGLAAWLGNPEQFLAEDPELARLLRGMAILKGLFVLAGFVMVAWRFGRPVSAPFAALYLAELWLAACASMMIWQLTWISIAAAAFHMAELCFLVTAWHDWRPRVQTRLRHWSSREPSGAERTP